MMIGLVAMLAMMVLRGETKGILGWEKVGKVEGRK